MDGIKKAKTQGIKFGRKSLLTEDTITEIKDLREQGVTVPEIMRRTGLSKASVYRALGR
jgi:DNA invertase Pin-like site-specific DNA recombinase